MLYYAFYSWFLVLNYYLNDKYLCILNSQTGFMTQNHEKETN